MMPLSLYFSLSLCLCLSLCLPLPLPLLLTLLSPLSPLSHLSLISHLSSLSHLSIFSPLSLLCIRYKHQLNDARSILKHSEDGYHRDLIMLKKTILLLQAQLREKKTFNKQAMAKEGHAQARAQLSREKYELCQVELQTTKSLLFELRAKYAKVTRGEGDRCNGKGRQAKQIIEATKGLEAMMLKRRMQRQQQHLMLYLFLLIYYLKFLF